MHIMVVLDYNECEEEPHGCEHVCVNDMGSYHCECRRGFFLSEDSKSCAGKSQSPRVANY